ncbi:retention module-containing protein, partial [uncultured Pseudoteredinibacter sp.]|uniref:retention module-containing protein n=1 Tax=uncultured Pseudoteredinibacter sp. TaxID=1641701 RepID=UPI00262C2292
MADNVVINDNSNTNQANTDLANSEQAVSDRGTVVAIKGVVLDAGAAVEMGQKIGLGDQLATQAGAAIVVKFPGGGLLVLGHNQSVDIDQRLLDLIRKNEVKDSVEEGIDFDRLQQGLEEGLSLEELLPATAAGAAPTGGGTNGSSAGTGVRFIMTGDETIPLAGFETTPPSNAFQDSDTQVDPIDSAPEAVDDLDEVTSIGIATGNVVTGIDVASGDENTLDGNADDSGINGFGDAIVIGVEVGDTEVELIDNSGVGVELVSDKGTLTLNADGSYNYVPNRDASGTDVFTYTIIDSDDDTSFATLTINIDGIPLLEVTDPGENPDGTLVNTVDEAGLPNGTDAGSGVEVTTGVINYLPGDGPATVTIAGVEVIDSNGQVQGTTIQGTYGTLVITSVSATQITYTYTLTDAADHSAGPVNDVFPIQIIDSDGNAADDINGNLLINIIDDTPIAEDQEDAIDSSLVATGNVITGIDIPGGDSNTSDGEADIAGADGFGAPTVVGVVAGETTETSDTGVGIQVSSDKGTIVINADGSYTYTANPGVFGEDVFTYTMTDSDGSTDVAIIRINVDAANILEDADESNSLLSGESVSGNVLANTDNPDGPEPAVVLTFNVNGTEFQAGETANIPGIGSIVINSNGSYTFNANPNFAGTVPPISYTLTDGPNTEDSQLNLTVIDPNAPPVASDDSSAGNTTNQPVVVDVLANDSDVDGTLVPSTVQIVGTPAPGTDLTVAGEGVWSVNSTTGEITFTPESGFTSDPTPINYVVSDDDGESSNTATVTISYTAQPPTAVIDSSSGNQTNQPVTVDVLANDSDPDGTLDPATVQIVGTPGAGDPLAVPGEGTWTVNTVTGEITFTPEAGFTADPTPISYTVADNDGNVSNTATVTIDYGVQPPVANNDTSNGNPTNQPVTVDVLGNDSDPDGNLDPTTVQIAGTGNPGDPLVVPGEGTWTVNPTTGAITFTPESGFTSDPTPISYTVQDNDGNLSNSATVTIDYSAQDPGANDDNETGVTNNPVTVDALANDNDPDGTLNPASVTITGSAGAGASLVVAGEGTWSVNTANGEITFTPEAGFTADPTPITYTVEDNDGNVSNTATITIDYAVQPPVANNDSSNGNTTNQPVTVDVLNNDNDPDGNLDPATVQITGTSNEGDSLTVPGEGVWSVNTTTGEITFTPESGFTADPTPITYTVKDNDGNESNTATVTVDYSTQEPGANDDSENGVTNNPVTVDVLDNDTDPDGTLDPATVQITGTSNAGDPLVVAGEGEWTVNTTTGEITFTPEVGFTADPTPITYTVDDNDGNTSNTATVTIDYAVQPPVATNDTSNGNTTNQPVTVDVLSNDSDPDGNLEPSTVQINGTSNPGDPLLVPGEGTWSVNPTTGAITFTPESGFTADPTPITYTVEDNDGNVSNPATVTVDYDAQDPTAGDDSENGVTNNPVTVDALANDNDPDGTLNPASVTITGSAGAGASLVVAGEGTWSVNTTNGEITFTPESGFTADPTPITYTVEDNDGNVSNTATVTIDYAAQPPVASNDSSNGNTTNQPVTVDVLNNDNDPDGNLDPATVQITGTPNEGDSLTVPGEGVWSVNTTTGEITFTPESGFTADPTPITYTVKDNDGNESNTATVTVDYSTQEPGANDDSENGVTNNPVTVDVLDNDTDPDGTLDPATVQITGTSNAGDPLVVAGEGEWTVNTTTGEITFTPDSGFTADPTPITYTVDDNDGNTSNTATVTIDYAVQPPVATNDVSNGNPLNTPVTVDVVANDSDPDGNIDPATVQIVGPSGPVSSLPVAGEGTWSVNPTTGAITFTPEPGFISDPTPIQYTIEDNDGNVSNPATVDVNYETAPTLSVQDITVNEADGTISITVSLSQTVSSDVTFSFQTNEGDEDSNPNNEATANSDFDTTSGNATITAGTLTTTISVPMNDDFVREGDENFLVNLSVSSANIDVAGSDLQGVVTIQDAGSPGQPEPPTGEDTVTLKVVATDSAGNIIGDGSENDSNEGGAAYYKVIALDPAGVEIASPAAGTVDVTFSNGTAGDADYDNATQNVTIGQVFQVDATDDLISDDEETYTVNLGANSTIAGAITTAYEAVTNSTDDVETTIHDETTPGTPPGPGPHPDPTPNP